MYAALWRTLPGPRAAKAAQCLVLLVVVVAVCFVWVFPKISPYMPFNNATVGSTSGALGVDHGSRALLPDGMIGG